MNMQHRWLMSAALMVWIAGWAGQARAEEPASVAPGSEVVEAAAEVASSVSETASTVGAEAVAAAASVEDNLDNLEFASGETTGFDAGKLQVKVYLDDAGNPAESTIELTVDGETEITNGEKDLDASSLKAGVEIDVEYDKTSKKATYIFVY